MLSRVANSLFWMARNIERAENNASVLQVQLINMLEADDAEVLDRDWEEVLEIVVSLAEYQSQHPHFKTDEIIHYVAFADKNYNSLINCMTYARENARATRDMIPERLWEVLNKFYLELPAIRRNDFTLQEIQDFLKTITMTSMTAQGVVESSMIRGVPYSFIKIGKWLERAEKTARILNVICEKARKEKQGSVNHHYYWLSALRLVNGYDAYIKEHPPTMDAEHVLQFIIEEDRFPRSIRYCMDHVMETINKLEKGEINHYSERLFQMLETIQQEVISFKSNDMSMEELMDFLNHFQNRCIQIGQIFSETYYLVEPVEIK
ncbi:alpha-E domain-containing protein [Thalassobacillus pellis]|uniref:alpha-E domain-containing protein n=1 Tax=Thalassobacillus pellis TaxID=748008 RepID=UPI00195FB727|nr:alpha-E domain-containing protein [Thalassobacillus pellis]MBM7551877.1 putative alpha-E superfamily protein [Thalassobacillus pellis]